MSKVRFSAPPNGHGYAYKKLKRKVGDYATAAAAVILHMTESKVDLVSIALTNVAGTPLYAKDACARVMGTALTPADIDAAIAAAEAIAQPASDGRGSAEYRTKMAGIMVRRALQEAAGRCSAAPPEASTPDTNERKGGGLFGWLKG